MVTKWWCRMGGAQRYPSPHVPALMGIAALHPSYGTMDCFAALAITVRSGARGICSPDERSGIRDTSHTGPGYRFAHPGYRGRRNA